MKKEIRKGFTNKWFEKDKGSFGFTLIETMIAIFVLTVGIVGVLCMFPVGVKIQKSAKTATIATFLVQEKIEETISRQYAHQDVSVGVVTENYGTIPGFEIFKRVREIDYYDLSNSTTSDDETIGIKKVTITVFWDSDEKDVKVSTFIARR